MNLAISFLSAGIIILGLFFLFVAGLGAVRLPDFYTRSHAIGVTDTLGTLLVASGVALYHGFDLISVKIFLLILFIYVANPVITHVFLRAAKRAGLEPWTGKSK